MFILCLYCWKIILIILEKVIFENNSSKWCWLLYTVACPSCRVKKVAVSAQTFIAPFQIWTQLVTWWCRCPTLIYILTLRLTDKLEPRVTRTLVPSVRIGAILITWSFETFVYVYNIIKYSFYICYIQFLNNILTSLI